MGPCCVWELLFSLECAGCCGHWGRVDVDVSQPVPVGSTLHLSSSQVCPFAELWAVKQGPFVC